MSEMGIPPSKHNVFSVDVGQCVANNSTLTEVPIIEADTLTDNVHGRGVSSIEDGCYTSTTSGNAVSKKTKEIVRFIHRCVVKPRLKRNRCITVINKLFPFPFFQLWKYQAILKLRKQ